MKQILALLLCCLISSVALAQLYKWTDKHGVVHYSDIPPGEQEKNTVVGPVEEVELSPIQILDDGSVTNQGTEDSGWLAQWLGHVEDWRAAARKKFAQWTGKAAPMPTSASNTVDLYVTAWCGACKKAKRWLGERGITYREYDVQKDANAALRMRNLGGGGGVPFAVINGETIQGFSPDRYAAALH